MSKVNVSVTEENFLPFGEITTNSGSPSIAAQRTINLFEFSVRSKYTSFVSRISPPDSVKQDKVLLSNNNEEEDILNSPFPKGLNKS